MGFLSNILPKPPFIPSPPTLSNPIPKPPKPAEVLLPPAPPKILGGGAQKAYDIATAPIKSTIAADPILSWAQNGKWSSHAARTRAGVHELYKQDRLAQRLGVREKDVVTVVEVAQVVVAIYFGASLLGAGSSAGAGAATSGTAAAEGVTLAGALEGVGSAMSAAKAVAGIVKKPGGSQQEASPEDVAPAAEASNNNKNGSVAAIGLGALGLLALLL